MLAGARPSSWLDSVGRTRFWPRMIDGFAEGEKLTSDSGLLSVEEAGLGDLKRNGSRVVVGRRHSKARKDSKNLDTL
jgi:hypothetical protein